MMCIVMYHKKEAYMELKTLCTFVKVANLKSFSKAANELGYTQAAVTIQIQQLEEELQTKLFERFSRSIALTFQGELFLQHASQILQACEQAKNALRQSDQIQGHLKIGIVESVCSSLFLELIQKFHKAYPLITLQITTDSPNALLQALDNNELDIIYFIDQKRNHKNWHKVLEKSEEIVFITHPNHPLLQKDNVSIQDILQQPLLLTEPNASYRLELEHQLASKNLQVDPYMEIDNTSFLIELVKLNMGISFLPRFSIEKNIRKQEVSILHPHDFSLSVWQQIIYHKNKWMSAHLKAFLEMVESEIQ